MVAKMNGKMPQWVWCDDVILSRVSWSLRREGMMRYKRATSITKISCSSEGRRLSRRRGRWYHWLIVAEELYTHMDGD